MTKGRHSRSCGQDGQRPDVQRGAWEWALYAVDLVDQQAPGLKWALRDGHVPAPGALRSVGSCCGFFFKTAVVL